MELAPGGALVECGRKMILLLGATGLLGGQVLRGLLERKLPVRVFTRGASDWKNASIQDLRRRGVEVIIADALEDEKLELAVAGCSAVINLVGAFAERKGASFEDIHVKIVERLLHHAKNHDVQRIIHVSCLGAAPSEDNRYLSTKWQAEKIVKNADCYWTILRPSFMFGEKFPFVEMFGLLLKFPPFFPLVGSGMNEIQPVCVDDVANFLIECIYKKETVGQIYELGGPEIYNMLELFEMMRQEMGLSTKNVAVPVHMLKTMLSLMAQAKSPIEWQAFVDTLPLLSIDSICQSNALETSAELTAGKEVQVLGDRLKKILSRI